MAEQDRTVLDLHQRLLAGDPVASSELAERFLPALLRATRAALRPGDDEHLADDAATDALLSYAERPAQYDPHKMSLEGYLRMAARGDLRNLRAQVLRRHARESRVDVELAEVGGNIGQEVPDRAAQGEDLERAALAIAHDAKETQVLQLMLDGERSTAAYADVLGIAHKSLDEQRRIVKRMKDRLKKRLERSSWSQRNA